MLLDCKRKRRRQSTRLEHLGIPEEELLRQQQELFAKAKLEQQQIEHREWLQLQNEALAQQQKYKEEQSFRSGNDNDKFSNDNDDY